MIILQLIMNVRSSWARNIRGILYGEHKVQYESNGRSTKICYWPKMEDEETCLEATQRQCSLVHYVSLGHG